MKKINLKVFAAFLIALLSLHNMTAHVFFQCPAGKFIFEEGISAPMPCGNIASPTGKTEGMTNNDQDVIFKNFLVALKTSKFKGDFLKYIDQLAVMHEKSTLTCGWSDAKVPRQPLPDKIVVEMVPHNGMCAFDCDGKLLQTIENCRMSIKDGTMEITDKMRSCKGMLRFTWLAVHLYPFELYRICINVGETGQFIPPKNDKCTYGGSSGNTNTNSLTSPESPAALITPDVPPNPELTTPPSNPELTTPPPNPELTTPPSNPGPTTPPSNPELTTPPSNPELTTTPSNPGPTTPPSNPESITPTTLNPATQYPTNSEPPADTSPPKCKYRLR